MNVGEDEERTVSVFDSASYRAFLIRCQISLDESASRGLFTLVHLDSSRITRSFVGLDELYEYLRNELGLSTTPDPDPTC